MEEGSVILQRYITSQENRSNFINSTLDFLKTYDFDGLDVDW